MIWIIGGTSETGEFLRLLDHAGGVVVTVATEAAGQFLDGVEVLVERMDPDRMTRFIQERGITLIVDLSHPYAFEVTENVRKVVTDNRIACYRFCRPRSEHQGALVFASLSECRKYLNDITGTVFFTTGSKNISDFQAVRNNNRFVYRILPALESVDACRRHHVAIKDIIAALGPFSIDLNRAMFEAWEADYVVMKNSGSRGGTPEKLEACRQLGITPIIIERESEDGFTSLNALADSVRQFTAQV